MTIKRPLVTSGGQIGELLTTDTLQAGTGGISTTGTVTGSNLSGINTGNETVTTVGALITGAATKTTPVDADIMGLVDSVASNILKGLSWLNLKVTLKTYFDTLYVAITSTTGNLTVPNTTATTIYTLPAGPNVYRVLVNKGATSDSYSYGAYAIVICDSTTARFAALNSGALNQLSLSGMAIQVSQSSGASAVINYSITKIG